MTMNVTARLPANSRVADIFASYVGLAAGLMPELLGIGVYDSKLKSWGQSGDLQGDKSAAWLRTLDRAPGYDPPPVSFDAGAGHRWIAIPIAQSDGTFLGIFCVSHTQRDKGPTPRISQVVAHLKPLIDCVHRDLAAARPASAKIQALTERAAELEWLFKITSELRGATDDQKVIDALLQAATERLGSALGVLCVPDKRLILTAEMDKSCAPTLLMAWTQTQPHLMTWAQRQNRPLIVNQAGAAKQGRVPCKVMCVPVIRESGRVIGVMAFYNPPQAADYAPRHVFLARHIGRQAASLIEAQFDLMTGLYTRSGLDQMFNAHCAADQDSEQSVIYLDIDHMRVANEMHGFELGNELIVRVADLLAVPALPQDALAARISGDRFAIVLPSSDCDAAKLIAETIQQTASQLVIGPSRDVFDVSVSGGVSILLPLPDGLSRAIAAAEIACKSAKSRGRNRIEIYRIEDGSMMRRHQDALAVGQLRSAMKADRLVLFAQRIQPLQNSELPGGYELLLRLREVDGTLVAPGPLIEAAQRYQILPAIDRWVVQRALQILAPHRSMFRTSELSMAINVSGQSIADEMFIQQLAQLLKDANLPRNCISIELTEQAAITNLARAGEMVQRLNALGCRFALDDFGTGANSLAYLKALQVNRVKIDGSFVIDVLTNRNSQATVRAVVELARGLGIETVAEYVENVEIAAQMKKMGVDYAQGYAFGKPRPLEDVLEELTGDESMRLRKLYLES
jgi:diguanylate cyclase (GGDEF)-like protein